MPIPSPTMPRITPDDRTPVPRTVAAHLQAMILRGDLKPGDQLPSQRELSEQFGVSRPSLREAVSVLVTMGLVTVKVGSGVYVADAARRAPLWRFSDRCSPRDVYEARYGLEGYAAQLAAHRIDGAGAGRLAATVNAMRDALGRGDIAGMAAADATFHDLVFELAANPVLAGMVKPVREMMVETQRLPMTLGIRLGDTLREHRAVADRISRGDAPGAEAAMKHHIRTAAARYDIEIDGDQVGSSPGLP